eukprot:13859-Pelagococcus_subviridis.AAC.2
MAAESNARKNTNKSSLRFEVLAEDGRARATRVSLRNLDCLTPLFMPVGTQGTVKGISSRQLEAGFNTLVENCVPILWTSTVKLYLATLTTLRTDQDQRSWICSMGFLPS